MKKFSVMVLMMCLIPSEEVRARAVAGAAECVRGDAKLKRNNRGEYELLTCDKSFDNPTEANLARFFRHFNSDANFKSRVEKLTEMKFDEALQDLNQKPRQKSRLFSKSTDDIKYFADKYRNFSGMKIVPVPAQNLPKIIQQNSKFITTADEKYNNSECPTSFRGQFTVFRVEFKDAEVMYILPMLLKPIGNNRYELFYNSIRLTWSQAYKRELHIPPSGDILWMAPDGGKYPIDRNKGFSQVADGVMVGHSYFGQFRDMSACELKKRLKGI